MPGWKRSICTFPQEVLWKTALEEAASWNLRVPGPFWPSCSFLNRLFLVSGVLLEKSVDALCAPLRVCDTATLASWCHGVVHEHVQVRESLGKTSTSICSDVTALLSTVYFVLQEMRSRHQSKIRRKNNANGLRTFVVIPSTCQQSINCLYL